MIEGVFKKIVKQSRGMGSRIIYDEIDDPRIQKAILWLNNNWFNPVIIWSEYSLTKNFGEKLKKIEHIFIEEDENATINAAKTLAENKVDWLISWAINPTSNTLRALIKNVWVKDWIKRISWYFLLSTNRWLILVADCAIQPNPNAEELAEIAYLSGINAKLFWIKPKIAMLSFSTKWSANHEMVWKVIKATELVKHKIKKEWLDFKIEWEIQLDAAIDKKVAENKIKWETEFLWWANVLVFPNLDAWNIWYKLIQYFGDAQAIWPIIQWLKKPWNDLSRWCSVEDIIILHAITVFQITNKI